MAGRRHKARARGIGPFGIAQGVFQRQRPFHHAGFQRFVGPAQPGDGGAFGSDVGKAHNEAPVGHLLGKDIQDQGIAAPRLERQGRARPVAMHPGIQPFCAHAVAKGHLFAKALQQVGKAGPHAEPRHRNGQQRPKPVVPAHKPTAFIKDANPLVDVIQRRADDARLIIQHLAAFLALQPDDLGDVGLQNDRAPIRRAVFGHLNPAVAQHAHVENDMAVLMPPLALHRPVFGPLTIRQFQIARPADVIDIVREGQARLQRLADVQHMHAKARVAQHQHIIGIEQGKTFLDRLDRIGQVLTRGFGRAVGLGQARVGVVQQIQRPFQIHRALAHLILQQCCALELGIGGTAVIGDLLDPPHQDMGDLQQLLRLPLGCVRRVDQRVDHSGPPAGG